MEELTNKLKQIYWVMQWRLERPVTRFSDLLFCALRLQVEQHWVRVVMDRETARLIDGTNPASRSTLEISGSSWGRKCSFKEYRSVFFPQYNVCAAPLSERFDLVIAEQVWEHLERPVAAARNVYEMLTEGGYFLVTTPFLIRVHEDPIDCSRWTEAGLTNLLSSVGFQKTGIVTGSWGNRECLRANLKRWMPYRPFLHSLDNEPAYPLVVWALAKK